MLCHFGARGKKGKISTDGCPHPYPSSAYWAQKGASGPSECREPVEGLENGSWR